MDKTALYKCPWCDVVKNLRGLACHTGKTHKQPASELHRLVLHNGIIPLCACGCGKPVKWLQKYYGEYLRGHNGFSVDARISAVVVRKDMASRGELTAWNAGLTKETDARVAASAIKISKTINRDDISQRLAARPEEDKLAQHSKQAISLRLSYAKGLNPWNKNLTKHTHKSLRLIAEKISKIKQFFDPRRLTPEQFEARANKSEKFELISNPKDYKNKYKRLLFKCKTCSLVQNKNLMMLENSPGFCPKCSPRESKGQLEIYEYVKSLFPEALLSDKTIPNVTELDIHVPSKNFGIEYNGLYWHSESAGKGPMYHQNKTDKCLAQGISLLHVYADDWENKSDIIRSMIKHRLSISSVRIYARNCSVRLIDSTLRKTFLERCHLDGDVASKVAFGLYNNDKLIAVLSLRKAFHKKWSNYIEIARFAVDLDSAVIGGLSKLISIAKAWAKDNNCLGLMSYADGRVGIGAGYLAAGFKQNSITTPTFWWTDYTKRYNRFKFRADKKRGMSESEIAKEAGVVRIYGCKNIVYTLNVN